MKNTKSMISTIYQTLHAADSEELEGIYKKWASDYDHDVLELAGYVGHLITSSLLLSKIKNKKAKILDAGCGTGLVGEILSEKNYKNVEGVDFSQEMLDDGNTKTSISIIKISRFNQKS